MPSGPATQQQQQQQGQKHTDIADGRASQPKKKRKQDAHLAEARADQVQTVADSGPASKHGPAENASKPAKRAKTAAAAPTDAKSSMIKADARAAADPDQKMSKLKRKPGRSEPSVAAPDKAPAARGPSSKPLPADAGRSPADARGVKDDEDDEDRVVELKPRRVSEQASQAQTGVLGVFDAGGRRLKAEKIDADGGGGKSRSKARQKGRGEKAGGQPFTGAAAAQMLLQQADPMGLHASDELPAW